MSISPEFLRKHKISLFVRLLKDSDFKLDLYMDNNKLEINRNSYNRGLNNESKIKPSRISSHELDKITRSNSYEGFTTEKHVYTEEDIEYLFQKTGKLNNLSSVKGVLWSDRLLEKYRDQWNWSLLSRNESIVWSKERIAKFKECIDFKSLSGNKNIELDSKIITENESKWDWPALSGNSTVGRNNERILLAHPKVVWKSKPELMYCSYRDINNLSKWNFKPSISTNSGIYWDREKFDTHAEKLDFWELTLLSEIDTQVVIDNLDKFGENRVVSVNFSKLSDWYDEHLVYRNSWENLFTNPQTKIKSTRLLSFLNGQNTKLINHNGDAREGFTAYEEIVKVTNLIHPHNLEIGFHDFTFYANNFSSKIISETTINDDVYELIIKPEFLKNKKYILDLINIL